MQPFTSKDGSRFTNRSTMMQHEARSASKAFAKQPVQADDDSMGGAEEEAQDGAGLAAEHGPATEVRVHHDHEAGKHTVHASHPDGHEHDSEHGSADEAHKFAGELAGVGGGGDMSGFDSGGMGGE